MLAHHVTQRLLALLRPVFLRPPDLIQTHRNQRSKVDRHLAGLLVYARNLARKLNMLAALDLC